MLSDRIILTLLHFERTKVPSLTGAMPDIVARGGLQIKVCVRTYRLFFVSHSEDIMVRLSSSKDVLAPARLLSRETRSARSGLKNSPVDTSRMNLRVLLWRSLQSF